MHAHRYAVLHSFGHGKDGSYPQAALVDVNGTLYGTTQSGGTYIVRNQHCEGTVFSLMPSGQERVLYSFKYGTLNGAGPAAALIDVKGQLYGTTVCGGGTGSSSYGSYGSGVGTIFRITTRGKETLVDDLSPDAANPEASLIQINGKLYGTTAYGTNFGAVFRASTRRGSISILHAFKGTDGANPAASLLDVNGRLYGTTNNGGLVSYSYQGGYGVVFSITTAGRLRTLHKFGTGTDGQNPLAALIDVDGTLYGTTAGGGAYGGGTVFSISTRGTEQVIYSFGNGNDGAAPYASLIDVNGVLYGTTMTGGAYGCGTVFSMTAAGSESILHAFGRVDGCAPVAGLLYANGRLYGTTKGGGKYGKGTAFVIAP